MIQNKVCVVTGGANGIGRCICETFLRNGYSVAIVDIDSSAGERLAEKFENLMFFHGDIAYAYVIEEFSRKVIERFHRVDVLVNNACLSKGGILGDCGADEFDYVMAVGARAPYLLTKSFIPCFADGASVINISSTRAFMSQKNTESYSAAKGAVTALTHAMAVSLAGKVRVNSVSPGWVDTSAYHVYNGENGVYPEFSEPDEKQHLSGRVGTPEDIAETVLFLSSERAGFITGENITVDGGMTKLMIYNDDHGWKYTP